MSIEQGSASSETAELLRQSLYELRVRMEDASRNTLFDRYKIFDEETDAPSEALEQLAETQQLARDLVGWRVQGRLEGNRYYVPDASSPLGASPVSLAEFSRPANIQLAQFDGKITGRLFLQRALDLRGRDAKRLCWELAPNALVTEVEHAVSVPDGSAEAQDYHTFAIAKFAGQNALLPVDAINYKTLKISEPLRFKESSAE